MPAGNETFDSALALTAERLAAARHTVALTGAGVSAESGLDTFRDGSGVWSRFDPEEVAGAGGWLSFLIGKPWDGVELLKTLRAALAAARPNAAHLALAALERAGRLRSVITQNVDGLHQAAGTRCVIELHGTLLRRRCVSCGARIEIAPPELIADIDAMITKLGSFLVTHPGHLLSRCDCGGLLRPDFVAFGEPVHDLGAATDEVRSADVLLVCGTSGLVHPAASLPETARAEGAFVVEINPEPTALSPLADVRIAGPAGRALAALADRLHVAVGA